LVGAVFGLAFDTATEIGLLNLSVVTASKGVGFGRTVCLPILFAAGMATADALDNLLMIRLFRTRDPNFPRGRQYMTTMTGLSVTAALTVGAFEALDLVRNHLSLNGPVWTFIHIGNENLALFGLITVGLFVITALVLSAGRRVLAYR
jgi:high-affinity nickel-transport protein